MSDTPKKKKGSILKNRKTKRKGIPLEKRPYFKTPSRVMKNTMAATGRGKPKKKKPLTEKQKQAKKRYETNMKATGRKY